MRKNRAHRLRQKNVHKREQPHQEVIGARPIEFGGHQFTEARPNQRQTHQCGCCRFSQQDSGEQRNPFLGFALAENGQGMVDRTDRVETEGRRIQVAQEPVAKRGFLLNHRRQFLGLVVRLEGLLQDVQALCLQKRDVRAGNHRGPGEVIALKIRISKLFGQLELLAVFNLFGQQGDSAPGITGKVGLLQDVGRKKIDLDDLGDLEERREV